MKVYFDTLGCLKNLSDSDMAQGMLEAAGHSIVTTPGEADAIVVNTCGFIDDAKRESIDEIFTMAEYKDLGKKLIVTGCLVQRYAKELAAEIPEADAFLGVNDYEMLPAILDQLSAGSLAERTYQREAAPDALERESRYRKIGAHPYTAPLRIAEGCDNHCTYCIIPKIRGSYRSRPIESLVEEAERLAAAGTKELQIIAQDTGCYGKDLYGKPRLADLLTALCRVGGIAWIRLMYCYEENIGDDLIAVMAGEPKICHYIDIPLQHGSGKVLREMNRKSTPDSIRRTLTRLRTAMPDICIRTTFMVGFPGETEEDYEALLDLVEEQRFDRLGAFAYSREEGTPAAARADQVPEEVKQDRLDGLMTLQMEISRSRNEALVGTVQEVMVDGPDEDGRSMLGRTRRDAPEIDDGVVFTPLRDHLAGDLVRVKILDAFDYDLEGVEVEDEPAQ